MAITLCVCVCACFFFFFLVDQLLFPLMAMCYYNGQGCYMSCIFIINKISTFYLQKKKKTDLNEILYAC